jgi:hypothetical protein
VNAERVWYRHGITGTRGYIVQQEGKDCIRHDTPAMEIIVPMTQDWRLDADVRQLSDFHVAQVAFEADKKLCLFLGLHDLARRDWMRLSDEERQTWIRGRVFKKSADRQRLHDAVREAMRPLAGP